MRSLCALVGGLLLSAAGASAQTATVTSGTVFLYWDGSLSGFQLTGPGTQLVGEVLQGSIDGLPDGTVVDMSRTVATNLHSNHPFVEHVNGTVYNSVWISATFTFTANPIFIPGGIDGATASFSTPFTMSGQFSGFADQALTQQLFSVSTQGSGVISVGPLRHFAGAGRWALTGAGGTGFTFTDALPSPWTSSDVGSAGTAGVSSYSNGTFYVAGAGADIWGATDAFQFVSQPLPADGSIVVQLDGISPTLSPFAKAGVMIRQSTSADSPHVLLDVKPDGGIEFMTRTTTGGSTQFIAGATTTGRPWLRLIRSGAIVEAAISQDGANWTSLGSATLAGNVLVGLAVTSHSNDLIEQAEFEQVAVTSGGGTPGTLPSPWSQTDVGAVGRSGSGSEAGGAFTVAGAGADMWGTADAFHFVYTSNVSEGSIAARVVSMDNTNPFAKAGVMFRASLDPAAAHVILDVRPDGNIEFMTRSASGADTTFIAGAVTSFPATLMLQRVHGSVDSAFVASVFESGAWRQIGIVTTRIGPEALSGLAVTSHDASQLNTAIFDTVEVARNLLVDGNFEGYSPPSLGPPGWISDRPLRQVAAVSDSSHPYEGLNDGMCSQTTFADCGLYQDVIIQTAGAYVCSVRANSNHAGAFVGVNINGVGFQSLPIDVHPVGDYGTAPYTISFTASAGDTVRVWMYSPATPGVVAIDAATLEQDFSSP
jgi:hypothetical protein